MPELSARAKAVGEGGGRRAREDVEHRWSAFQSLPRCRSYPILGAVLALGAPVGLLFVRAVEGGRIPTFASLWADMHSRAVTYAYVTFATVAVLGLLGYLLGRLFDDVRLLSITDPLTGLFNRRHFQQRLAEETRRGRRYDHPTSVLCVDIDRLKAINDAFGHKAGDSALVSVCRTLQRSVRAIDVVARLGGDEFAVLLPETSAARASALSQRILIEVGRHGEGLAIELAVSIGIAELSTTPGVGLDDLLAAADEALYRAKAAGGGHCVVVRPQEGHPAWNLVTGAPAPQS